MLGNDLFGEPIVDGHKSVLAQTFEYPPFSVLNAREGWWQERKRQWLALGIKSEVGRGGGATWNCGFQYDGPDLGQFPADHRKRAELLPQPGEVA
jgi:hypothetical protein